MSDDRDSASGVILAFLLGGLAGAALATLYAPRSGRETRDLLGEKIREGKERGRQVKEKLAQRGKEMMDEAAGYIERQKEELADRKEELAAAVDAGKAAYREEKEKA